MGVKHRYIDRRNWSRILSRTCYSRRLPDGAAAFRTDIHRLTAPGMGFLPGVGPCMIANEGWCWLGWMRPDFPWALTVMCDENGSWVQAYFDIVTAQGTDADGRSWFEDAWLDVVALPDGRIFLLDEDELAQAVSDGEVTAQMADSIRKNAQELINSLQG